MSKQSNEEQVKQDERDAEKRYLDSITAAEVAAECLAADNARTEAARVAAAETATALRRTEEARRRAEAEPTPEAARQTFREWLRSAFN